MRNACWNLLTVLANLTSMSARFLPSPFCSSKLRKDCGILNAAHTFFCIYLISSMASRFFAPASVSIGVGALGSLTGMNISSDAQLETKQPPLSLASPSLVKVRRAKLCRSSLVLAVSPSTVIQYTSSPSMISTFFTV